MEGEAGPSQSKRKRKKRGMAGVGITQGAPETGGDPSTSSRAKNKSVENEVPENHSIPAIMEGEAGPSHTKKKRNKRGMAGVRIAQGESEAGCETPKINQVIKNKNGQEDVPSSQHSKVQLSASVVPFEASHPPPAIKEGEAGPSQAKSKKKEGNSQEKVAVTSKTNRIKKNEVQKKPTDPLKTTRNVESKGVKRSKSKVGTEPQSSKAQQSKGVKSKSPKEWKHKCTFCPKSLPSPAALERHVRSHTGEKPFICKYPNCGKKYSSKNSLRNHEALKHTKILPHKCSHPSCEMRFPQLSLLRKHERIHSSLAKHKCSLCGKLFDQPQYLNQHIRRKHTGDKPHQCADPNCNMAFFTESELKIHKRVHTREKPFACPTCNKRFSIEGNMRVHERTHTGEKPFQCTHCDKKFSQSSKMKAHVRAMHTDNRFICSTCGKRFRWYGNLKAHEFTHSGEWPQICTTCGSGCKDKAALSEHEKTHTIKRPHICQFCNKAYAQKCSLGRHLRIHTGERPFICNICGKGFIQSNNRDDHLRTHTRNRPHKCNTCGKRFNTSTQLKRHKLCHRNYRDYFCTNCGRGFSIQARLTQHLLSCTGKLRFSCEICNEQFKSRSGVICHRIREHYKDKLQKCRYCNHKFDSVRSLRIHIYGVHGLEKKFKCQQCPAAFVHSHGLKQHVKLSHEPIPILLECGTCGEKFTTSKSLRMHERQQHSRQIREREIEPHDCVLCTPHLPFPNKTSYVIHRIIRHPGQLTEEEDVGVEQVVAESTEKVFFNKPDLEWYMKKYHSLMSCKWCECVFLDQDSFRQHLAHHHLIDPMLSQSGRAKMKTALEEARDDMEKVYRMFELSKNLIASAEYLCKLYKCLLLPVTIRTEADIREQVALGNQGIKCYIGKLCSMHRSVLISPHHTNSTTNPVSTNILMAITKDGPQEYHCIHFNDEWIQPEAGITGQDGASKMEVIQQFTLLLFCKRYGLDFFFQDIQLSVLRHYLTDEILKTCVEAVEESRGDLFNLRSFNFQFIRNVNISTNKVKKQQLAFSKCRQCPNEPTFMSRHHKIKHDAIHHVLQTQRTPLQRLLLLKELTPREPILQEIVKIVQSATREMVPSVYAAVAIQPYEEGMLMETLGLGNGVDIYFGQSTYGEVSQYHFSTDGHSSIRAMKTNSNRIVVIRKWICESTREMYRLERYFILIYHLRRLFATADPKRKDNFKIVNKLIQLYDLERTFTVEEYVSIYNTARSSRCLIIDGELPEFISVKKVNVCEHDITDFITKVDTKLFE